MSILNKLGKSLGLSTKELDVEEYMNAAEMDDVDIMHEPADMYVKPVSVASEDDVKLIEEELAKKNIILLSIEELAKRPTTRNNVIARLKSYASKINGDIAQIDDTRVLITPAKVKIIKRKKAAAGR